MHPKTAIKTTSVKVILEWAKEKLLEAQVENPILDARLLLGFALGTPQERFYGSEDNLKIGSEITLNGDLIGKLLIGNPYPFGLINIFNKNLSKLKNKEILV